MPQLPPRQWHTQPSPNTPPGDIPVPLPKKCYGWHTKPPLEGLKGNSGVLSSWKGRGKVGRHKKGGRKTTLIIIFPTNHREENSFDINYLLSA